MWFAVPFIYRCAIAVHPRAGMASRNTAIVHCADSPCTVPGRRRATGYGGAQHQGCVQNGWGRDVKHTVPERVYRKVLIIRYIQLDAEDLVPSKAGLGNGNPLQESLASLGPI